MRKESEKLQHTHTLKITKHQEYLFCDMVSLSDQRNIRIIEISPIRLPLNIIDFFLSKSS